MYKPNINLDEKSPNELRTLLNLVKTGPMSVNEKEHWVNEINSRLSGKSLDIQKARMICAEIEAGMADINDAGN